MYVNKDIPISMKFVHCAIWDILLFIWMKAISIIIMAINSRGLTKLKAIILNVPQERDVVGVLSMRCFQPTYSLMDVIFLRLKKALMIIIICLMHNTSKNGG